MTVIDILIYVFFAFFSSSLAKKSVNYVENNDLSTLQWDKYLVYFILFFTVIGGIRWNVGVDSLSYAHWFTYPQPEAHSKEGLWWFFVNFIQANGIHWTIGLAVCSFIQIFFITEALKTYRWLLVFIPFVFFGGRYWMDCMNAVRQMIVACGFFWASKYIYEKKIFKYCIFILLASLIHQSALILLPFYFIPASLNITNKRFILIGILLVCFIAGQTPAFQGTVRYFQMIADVTNYDGYGVSMSEMLMRGKTSEALSFGPMMMTYLLIPIFIIWYGPTLYERYGEKLQCFNGWFILAFFYACYYFLACNISHLFIRPAMYFSLFQLVMASILLNYLWSEYRAYGVRQVATFLFCVVIFTNTAWDIAKASGKSFETTTYKVFFMHTSANKPLGI